MSSFGHGQLRGSELGFSPSHSFSQNRKMGAIGTRLDNPQLQIHQVRLSIFQRPQEVSECLTGLTEWYSYLQRGI